MSSIVSDGKQKSLRLAKRDGVRASERATRFALPARRPARTLARPRAGSPARRLARRLVRLRVATSDAAAAAAAAAADVTGMPLGPNNVSAGLAATARRESEHKRARARLWETQRRRRR